MGVSPYIEFARQIYRMNVSSYIDKKVGLLVAEPKDRLREDSIDFAIIVSDYCDEIRGCSVFINQLLRCSSSIGANIHEARYAQSRADFISKMEIALKECSETDYWLELLRRKGRLSQDVYKRLNSQCGSIRRRLIASITTAKANATPRKENQ